MNLRLEHSDPDALAAYLSGVLNADEMRQVEAWIAASEENRKEFEAYRKVWQLASPEPDTEAALHKVLHRIDQAEAMQKEKAWPVWLSLPLKVAAIFLPLALIGYFLIYRVQEVPREYLRTQENLSEHLLPDGSSLSLNTHSVISYAAGLSGEKREVHLEGEAFFEVEKDALRPFIVVSNDLNVRVLGTRFNVNAYPDQDTIRVSVEEGKVGLYVTSGEALTDSLLLTAGEEGVYVRSENKLLFRSPYNSNLLFWKHRTLSFDKTPLKEVLATMSRAIGQRLILNDPRKGDLRLTATFEDASKEQMLDVLAETFHLKWERNDTSFVLYAPDSLPQ